MEWLNELVAQLWPNINNAVQKIVHEQATEKLEPLLGRIESTNTREVTPQLQASLPSFLKGAARLAVRSAWYLNPPFLACIYVGWYYAGLGSWLYFGVLEAAGACSMAMPCLSHRAR